MNTRMVNIDSNSDGRIEVFDALKGVAIILMIYNHVHLDGLLTSKFIGVFHMPLFFLLSGYLYKQRFLGDVLIRNMRKIIIPYLITCSIIWLYYIIIQRNFVWGWAILWGNSKPLESINSSISVGPLWFLTSFFMAMIYVNFLFRLKKALRWSILLSIFSCSVLITKIYGILLPFGITTGLGGGDFYDDRSRDKATFIFIIL